MAKDKGPKKHPHYHRVKCALLEQQQVALNAKAAVAQASAHLNQVMQAAGLDPAKRYTMNDDTETIVVATQ